jgi:hypothetical protein
MLRASKRGDLTSWLENQSEGTLKSHLNCHENVSETKQNAEIAMIGGKAPFREFSDLALQIMG